MSKRLTKNHFEELCESRNHVLLSFEDYTGIKSKLAFRCNNCGHEWSSSAHSYKISKTGCWGCKKKAISEMTKTRVFTLEGRKRLSDQKLGKPSWNKGIKGSVPGGGSKNSTWKPTVEQRLLPGILYLIRYLDDSGTHFKLGITRKKLSQRFSSESLVSIIQTWNFPLGKCFDLEQAALRYASQHGYRYASPTTTELIRPEGMVSILEFIEQSLDDDEHLAEFTIS
jgi:hypothetical protein